MRMHGVVVFAVLVAAAIAAPAPVQAECGIPSWMGTRTAAPVPIQGSLYIYIGNGRGFSTEPTIAWRRVGNAEIVHVSETVVRIDYSGVDGAELVVSTPWDQAWTYRLDASWHAAAFPPRVLQYWHHVYEWACSQSDSLMLQTDQETAAYRVRWTPRAGMPVELVMPARTDFDRSALELGKINCSSASLPVDELAAGGHLELTAIRLDRSEVPVTGLPAGISMTSLPTSDDGLGHAFLISPQPLSPPPPVIHAETPLGILVVLAFVIGLYLALCLTLPASSGSSLAPR